MQKKDSPPQLAADLEEIVVQRDIDGWLDAINNSDDPKIDKDQLACATRLIHDCGLRKNELPGLNVGDVEVDQNGSPTAVKVSQKENARRASIPLEARPDIKKCLESVSASGDQSGRLLPKYQQLKTLGRHLKSTLKTRFKEMRKDGMKDAAERGGQNEDIGSQFGISGRSAEQSIHNKIQPAGTPSGSRKKDEVDHLMKELDDIKWIETMEALNRKEAEIKARLGRCTIPRFMKDKDSWENKQFPDEFDKRRKGIESEREVDQLQHYDDRIPSLNTSEELENFTVEVKEFLDRCNSQKVVGAKDFLGGHFLEQLDKQRKEIELKKEATDASSRKTRKSILVTWVDDVKNPRRKSIEEMLGLYYRKIKEVSPPDPPEDETPEKKP